MSKRKHCPVNRWIRKQKVKSPRFSSTEFCKAVGISRMALNNHDRNPDLVWKDRIVCSKIHNITRIPTKALNPKYEYLED